MTTPSSARDLVAESAVLIARAERAIAASRALLGSSGVLARPARPPAAAPLRVRGFADLKAWNARER